MAFNLESYKYPPTKKETGDKVLHSETAQSFEHKNSLLTWDLKTNLQRIEKQKNGDTAFYFLAIISFIEGFIRDYYGKKTPEFLFDKFGSDFKRPHMFRHMKNNMPSNKPITAEEERTINLIYHLMCTHSDSDRSYYIDGDRIRHCFTQQTKNNMRLMLMLFIDFAKIFGFYHNNIELFHNLIDDNNYFLPLKEHQMEDNEELGEDFYNNQLLKTMHTLSWRNYQQIISSLTKEQKDVADKLLASIQEHKEISKLIKGGPGTGKTLILINLLQQTLNKNIKLLTYSDSLTQYNKYLANLISLNGKKLTDYEKEKLVDKIQCFDSYFLSILKQILKGKRFVRLKDLKLQAVDEISERYRIKNDRLLYEAKEIWLNLPEEEKYVDLTYAQSTPASKDRKEIRRNCYLKAVSELKKYFDTHDTEIYPLELAFYKIQKGSITIPDELKPDYLLIDEVQDLEAAKIETIRKICRKGFILAGDLTQSVFVRKGLPWSYLEEKVISTTSLKLTKNFRSTVPIQTLAARYKNLINIKDENITAEGFLPGPYPEAYKSQSLDTACDKIVETIKTFKEQISFQNRDFCIIAPNKNSLDKLAEKLEEPTIDLETCELDFEKNNSIRLSRFKYVKGIDIPIVILILDKNFIDKKSNDNLDIFGQENGIYTSISRAMNLLQIYFVDGDGQLLKEGKDNLNSVCKLYGLLKDSVVSL